jgi:hypothetical protein
MPATSSGVVAWMQVARSSPSRLLQRPPLEGAVRRNDRRLAVRFSPARGDPRKKLPDAVLMHDLEFAGAL